ncbi:DEAD/DEAH box helicase [Streptococcus suis]|nr:DEAD/DEAH box helicase [Streptococcus suis]MCQ8265965.1 DEAD/DEAH box helicase [Streptococcus suis]HEL9645821.1 DEAD/DEAH box helicase [Streptococcus suis]
MKELEHYYGRLFTKYQLTATEREKAVKISSITNKNACFRCGTSFEEDNKLPNGAYYCRACLLLGRVRSDEELYHFPQEAFPPQTSLKWQGKLTAWQQLISDGLCQNVQEGQATLVHAVTGAGKTEMIYELVASVIDRGGAVCLASPRIDVCIELYKRLQNDFSCPISLLHGQSESYFRTPLVIATTHQLLKFYQAFDLVLIDEVDAFPYVDNPMLYRAVDQSVKPDGVQVFLTATSTDELDRKVKNGQLDRLRLPKRFHGNPLIVPQKVWFDKFQKQLKKGKLVPKLHTAIQVQRQTGYPLLLFAPEIKTGQELVSVLEKYFPDQTIGFVSSQTENRLEVVQGFRDRDIDILVSTTILERGVTFPCVDVFVVEANHYLYTSSSLIQIAGRVGRSMDRPTGQLLFFHGGTNRAIEKAIAEIKLMNKEAGYV